ncbi:MAG: RnfABCDGE type electron transport complex subunit D, partial [Clostridia bacterium]|nr:RnfABCDGE type electron transport complex subunit D [Clostridia bacterium]
VRRVLNFRWPLVYMAAVGVVSLALSYFTTKTFEISVLWNSILTGGVVLGGVFMATDYVTSPNTKLGNYIYFAFIGLLTAVLRFACKTEVVSYVILLGNLIVPLINKFTARKPFGYQKPQKEDK